MNMQPASTFSYPMILSFFFPAWLYATEIDDPH